MRREGRATAAQVYPPGQSRRRGAPVLVLALWATVAYGAQPVPIDRLVAVVEQRALMQSDVAVGLAVGSLTASPDGTPSLAEQLVGRELIRLEVERFAVADPAPAALDARLRALSGGVPVAEWLAQVSAGGIPVEGVRRWVSDDLRIEAYLDQRFGAAAQPTEVEVVERARAEGAGVPVPQPALDAARAALTATRRAALVEEWLAGLRRRSAVRIVTAP